MSVRTPNEYPPSTSTSRPTLGDIHAKIASDATTRACYTFLKRVTLSDLDASSPSYRRGYVEACLACLRVDRLERVERIDPRIREREEESLVGLLLLCAQGLASLDWHFGSDADGCDGRDGRDGDVGEISVACGVLERVCGCVEASAAAASVAGMAGVVGVETRDGDQDWRVVDWGAKKGVYALSMVKFLNKVALGLLAGREDGGRLEDEGSDRKSGRRESACLRVVGCMGAVGRAGGREVHERVCRGVVAMAAHGTEVVRWMGAVVDVSGYGGVGVGVGVGVRDDYGRGTQTRGGVVEACVSCVRRLMVVAKNSSGAGETKTVAKAALWVLKQVSWLYGGNEAVEKDGHVGVAALGAVVSLMGVGGRLGGEASVAVRDAFCTAMECLERTENVVNTKEMVWLAGVLYAKGREGRSLGWLLAWSLRCSLTGLRLASSMQCSAAHYNGTDERDEGMIARCCSDVVQCVILLADGYGDDVRVYGTDGHREDVCGILVDVAAQMRACGKGEDVTSLLARVVKRVYTPDGNGREGNGKARRMTVRGVLDAALQTKASTKSTKSKASVITLCSELAKDGIGALAGAMRVVRRRAAAGDGESTIGDVGSSDRDSLASLASLASRITSDAASVLSFVHEVFNPAKVPEPYVEVVMACYAHMDAFPELLSVKSLSKSLEGLLEETNTKIGKRRIGDVAAVMELLRVDAAVNDLLKASLAHGEAVAWTRKNALRKDPTLVHSEEWIASDSLHESVAFMVKNAGQWGDVVSEAIAAVAGVGSVIDALDLGIARGMEAELTAFVGLHDTDVSTFLGGVLSLSPVGAAKGGSGDDMMDLKRSMEHAQVGDVHGALRCAIEGHRRAESRRKALRQTLCGIEGSCWWSALSAHVMYSAWLGFLFSTCGMYTESRRAYSDGLRTACQVGATAMAVYFSTALAELHLVGGGMARFQAHVGDAVKLLASMNRIDQTDRLVTAADNSLVGLLTAHVDVLCAAAERTKLEFDSAASRLSQLSLPSPGACWYRTRIAAAASWQEALLELDQESTVTSERIEVHLSKLVALSTESMSAPSSPVLMGASYAMTTVLLAQALCVPFFDHTTGKDNGKYTLWTINAFDEHQEEHARLATTLARLATSLHASPFCQRTVLQLLAPVVASLGCTYAAIALLHASSNPTLEFQQALVTCMKDAVKTIDEDDAKVGRSLPPSRLSASCAPLLEVLASTTDLASVESCAKALVRGWTGKVPGVIICGMAVYDSATFGLMRPRRDRLVLHRLKHGQVPLIVEVPSGEAAPSHPIHALHGTKACGAVHFLGERLVDILKRSNKNMRSVSSASSDTEQRAWWQERVELDHSMQQLLQELQVDWIGPWRCLFLDAEEAQDDGDDTKGTEKLLRGLLASARLSAMELTSISRLLGSLDIDAHALADEFDARLQLGKSQNANPTARRQVSFSSSCRDVSPDMCGTVRSAAVDNDDVDGLGNEENDFVARVADTPRVTETSPSKTHVTVRRKHKSRMAHLQPMATPNPRRALGACNFAVGYQTPALAKTRSVGRTAPMTVPIMPRRGSCDDGASDEPSNARTATVALVLDQAVQALPWESSFLMMTDQTSDVQPIEFYRLPSLPSLRRATSESTSLKVPSSSFSSSPTKLTKSISSTFFAINPSGDLRSTQETFESWFRNINGWSGVSGRAPTADELGVALQHHDLFVYCGHGGGEQYLPASRLRALDSCASAILMGCSSGKLTSGTADGGVYDATGTALSYLMAGAPAVVGNLWDVTDKDIDRYCTALLTAMVEHDSGANLGTLVQQCRLSCRLAYLIGASPVVYGLPVRFV